MKAKNIEQPSVPPVQQWDDVAKALSTDYAPGKELANGPGRYTTWLTTINRDGSPHVTAVGALFIDGTFWFQTGEGTLKARNIARDPRCAVSISANELDLTFEGAAEKVNDKDAVARCVADWNKGGWPCEVDESGIGITAPFQRAGNRPGAVVHLPADAPSCERRGHDGPRRLDALDVLIGA